MHRWRLVTLLAVVAVAVAAVAPAHAQQPPQLAIANVDAAAYPDITVIVTVLDGRGAPAAGLTKESFRAFEGETPVDVTEVQAELPPLGVVLALDVSTSMEGTPLAQAKLAAQAFVRSLRPEDEAALITFAGAVETALPFTKDKAALEAAIAPLSTRPATALFEAVQVSAAVAAGTAAPRRAAVLLTDGQNDTQLSAATRDGSLSAARDSGVPFFTIGFGALPDAAYLQAVADVTRGQYRGAAGADVSRVYDEIAAVLRNQYVLKLRASGRADGAPSQLRLVAGITGVPAEASAPFARGAAVPVPTAAPSAPPSEDEASNGVSALVWIAVAGGGVVGLFLVVGGGRRFAYAVRQRRLERHAGRASDEGVPEPAGIIGRSSSQDEARGRIVVLDGEAAGTGYQFGSLPLTIGSGPRANVRLPASDDVAPEHALVWMRDGKMTLRHVGGQRRRTYVGQSNRPVDWVILDEGDEFRIGPHRFRAERAT